VRHTGILTTSIFWGICFSLSYELLGALDLRRGHRLPIEIIFIENDLALIGVQELDQEDDRVRCGYRTAVNTTGLTHFLILIQTLRRLLKFRLSIDLWHLVIGDDGIVPPYFQLLQCHPSGCEYIDSKRSLTLQKQLADAKKT